MLDPWGTVKASPGLVYITAKIKTGWFTSYHSVFCWDGERLRQVLGRGDEIEGYPVRSAQTVAVGPKGGAAIAFVTTEPAKGLALHDGAAVTAVWRNGDLLPVPQAWRFNFRAHSSFYLEHTNTPVALPSPEVVILLLDFEDPLSEKSKRVLLRLTREKAESIIAVGEPCAALPRRTVVTNIEPRFVALSPDCVVFNASSRVLLYDRGRVLSLASAEWRDLTVVAAALLRAPPPSVVFGLRQVHEEQSGSTRIIRHRVDVALCDGERAVNLTNDFAFDDLEGIRSCPYPFCGVMVEGVRGIPTRKGELEPEKGTSKWFLDIDAIEKGLQAPPQFATSEKRVVSLGDVVDWVNPRKAIVRLHDGFHMLSRRDEGSEYAPASDAAG
jgi:hypothetical protein